MKARRFTPSSSETGFYARWVGANVWSEGLGLGTTFLVGTQTFHLVGQAGPRAIIATAVFAIALGIVLEGVLVGFAQGRVLHRRLPAIPVKKWVLATAAGAGLAWIIGMIPSTIIGLLSSDAATTPMQEPTRLIQTAMAAGLGFVAGPILGVVQWSVLRRYVRRSGWWLLANALAWAVGMPVIFAGMDLVPWNGPVVVQAIAIYSTCVLAGLVVGIVHGLFLVRLIRES